MEDMEADPYGHGYLDVDKLLEACEITEPVPGSDVEGYRRVRHRGVPDYPIMYVTASDLPDWYIRRICEDVRYIYSVLGGAQ